MRLRQRLSLGAVLLLAPLALLSFRLFSDRRQPASSRACLSDHVLEIFAARNATTRVADGNFLYTVLSSPVSAHAALSPDCAAAVVGRPVSEGPDVRDGCFDDVMSDDTLLKVYTALHELQGNFTSCGLEFMLNSGTLLGSLRHFGFIPWDDDLDVLIRHDQKPQVRRLLERLGAGDGLKFRDTERENGHWKLGILCQPAGGGVKRCPIELDLFFFGLVGRVAWRRDDTPIVPTRTLLPASLRPFGHFLMRVPHRPADCAARIFGEEFAETCVRRNHGNSPCNGRVVPCDALRARAAFARRLVIRYGHRLVQAELLVRADAMLALFVNFAS